MPPPADRKPKRTISSSPEEKQSPKKAKKPQPPATPLDSDDKSLLSKRKTKAAQVTEEQTDSDDKPLLPKRKTKSAPVTEEPEETDSDDKPLPVKRKTKPAQVTEAETDSDDRPLVRKKNSKTQSKKAAQDTTVPEDWQGSKNTKQARERQRLKRKISNEQKQDAVVPDTTRNVAAIASAILTSTDPILKETRRIAKTMQSAKRRRAVLPVVPDEDEVPAATLLQHVLVPGRNVVPKRITHHKKDKCWIFYFDDQGTVSALHSKEGEIRVPYLYLPETATKPETDALHQELARIYNTWPFIPLSVTGRTITFRQWIVIAFTNVNRRHQEIFAPVIQGSNYRIVMHYFDSKTGEATEVDTHVSPADTAMAHVQVPSPLPDIYLRTDWGKGNRKLPLVTASNPQYIGPPKNLKVPSSTASQHKCQEGLRWISLQLTGMVTSPERMKELVSLYREMVGFDAKTARGVYGDEGPLYYVEPSKSTSQLFVVPSAVVKRDIIDPGISKWHIVINSLNASRATPVLDTIIQTFCAGEDIRCVWIEAAKVADEVNLAIKEGALPSTVCDCDAAHVSTELHACGKCTKPAVCSTRSFDSLGRLVCPKCQARDQAVHGGRRTNETLLQYLVRTTLSKSFYRECKARQVDPLSDESKAALKEALDDVLNRCADDQPTTYRCAYSGGQYDVGEERPLIGTNPSRRRIVPHSATVDAGFPEGEPKHRGFKHSPGNLEIVTFACQFAKNVYLPGVLHVIGEYLRKAQKQAPTAEDKSRLLDALFDMTVVALKRAHVKKSNLAADEDEAYQKIKAEMVCGKPTPGETGPWEEQARRYTSGVVPSPSEGNLWDDETYERSQKCAESIAKYFDVEIPKLQDGTYWPLIWRTDGRVHRNGIALLCRERLKRMRLMCNKKWQTDDTEQSLYAEILFQYCASMTKKTSLAWLKAKYGDRLGLPLNMWINSPLRFSIAHRLHGFGMFTGWPAEPTDVQERIDNDKNNNMLIESGFVNFAKQDVAEDYYPQMDDILRNVDLLKNGMQKYYDPKQSPPAKVDNKFTNIAASDLDDVDDIPFDDDELQGFLMSLDTDVSAQGGAGIGNDPGAGGDDDQGGEEATPSGLNVDEGGDVDMTDRDVEVMNMQARVQALRSIVLDDEQARQVFRANPRVVDLLSIMQSTAAACEGVAFRAADEEIEGLLFPQ